MPTYEYKCQGCGHKFELMQSIKSVAVKKCPKCKKDSVKRLISAGAGIIFKGSGFYATDYKNAGKPKCDKAGSKNACSSCPGSSAK